MRALHRALRALEAAWTIVTSVSMFAIMVLVAVDVILRYLFNKTLGWSYDLISMYLMAAIFLLALSSTLRDGHHVRVDILYVRAPERARRLMTLVGYALTTVVMAPIAWTWVDRTWTSFVNHDVIVTSLAWPTWISGALVVLGAGLLCVRLVLSVVALAMTLAGRSAPADLVAENADDPGA